MQRKVHLVKILIQYSMIFKNSVFVFFAVFDYTQGMIDRFAKPGRSRVVRTIFVRFGGPVWPGKISRCTTY